MALLESMSRDLSRAQRISINEVRINILNNALYDEASEDMIQGLMESRYRWLQIYSGRWEHTLFSNFKTL